MYQGAELWNFHLVDPDNRGPVDYVARAAALEELRVTIDRAGPDRAAFVRSLFEQPEDGRVKLLALMLGLDQRRRHPELFQQGDYLPLECGGSKKQHLCAFARVRDRQAVMTVVPRLVATLAPDEKRLPVGTSIWEDSWVTVPPWPTLGEYRHVLTGEIFTAESVNGRRVLPLSQVFGHCPVALLERLS